MMYLKGQDSEVVLSAEGNMLNRNLYFFFSYLKLKPHPPIPVVSSLWFLIKKLKIIFLGPYNKRARLID